MESQLTTVFFANALDIASAFTLSLINYTDGLDACNKGRESAVTEVSRGPLACSDLGFESHRGHGYLSVVSVVCCQVEVSATS